MFSAVFRKKISHASHSADPDLAESGPGRMMRIRILQSMTPIRIWHSDADPDQVNESRDASGQIML
jgi:hypothetical protein